MRVAEGVHRDPAEHVEIARAVGGDQIHAFAAHGCERETFVRVEESGGFTVVQGHGVLV